MRLPSGNAMVFFPVLWAAAHAPPNPRTRTSRSQTLWPCAPPPPPRAQHTASEALPCGGPQGRSARWLLRGPCPSRARGVVTCLRASRGVPPPSTSVLVADRRFFPVQAKGESPPSPPLRH